MIMVKIHKFIAILTIMTVTTMTLHSQRMLIFTSSTSIYLRILAHIITIIAIVPVTKEKERLDDSTEGKDPRTVYSYTTKLAGGGGI